VPVGVGHRRTVLPGPFALLVGVSGTDPNGLQRVNLDHLLELSHLFGVFHGREVASPVVAEFRGVVPAHALVSEVVLVHDVSWALADVLLEFAAISRLPLVSGRAENGTAFTCARSTTFPVVVVIGGGGVVKGPGPFAFLVKGGTNPGRVSVIEHAGGVLVSPLVHEAGEVSAPACTVRACVLVGGWLSHDLVVLLSVISDNCFDSVGHAHN